MKLWLLRPREEFDELGKKENESTNPWNPWYDKCFGMVIRADSEDMARKIASTACSDEGSYPWLSEDYSTCVELVPSGEPRIIIKDEHMA